MLDNARVEHGTATIESLMPDDPKAGRWGHEVFGRLLRVLVWSALSGAFAGLALVTLVPPKWEVWVYPPLLGLYVTFPEALLRRSWRFGGFAALLGVAATILCFYGLNLCAELSLETKKTAALVTLGGTVGILGGIGARSPRAAALAAILGCLGGYLASQAWLWLRELDCGPVLKILLIVISQATCVSTLVGCGVAIGTPSRPSKNTRSVP